MGVIIGGSASGLLPEERFFAVNFPGYPTSLQRATQALGGEARIAEVRSQELLQDLDSVRFFAISMLQESEKNE